MTQLTRIMHVATSYPRDLGDLQGLFIHNMPDAFHRRGDLDGGCGPHRAHVLKPEWSHSYCFAARETAKHPHSHPGAVR